MAIRHLSKARLPDASQIRESPVLRAVVTKSPARQRGLAIARRLRCHSREGAPPHQPLRCEGLPDALVRTTTKPHPFIRWLHQVANASAGSAGPAPCPRA